MARQTTKPQSTGSSKLDAALQRFSDMLIKRMEEMKLDWHKGWTQGKAAFGLPQNISGRTYEGSNAFLLFLHTSQNNYKAPVYMTFLQAKEEGVSIKQGEKSVPVFKWGLSVKDKDGMPLPLEDYDNMSEDEKKECDVRHYLKVYSEFNIDQTNLREVNREKYDAILSRFDTPEIMVQTDGMYVNKALDRMMKEQEWVCKIQYDKEEPGAYYSPSKDIVVLPTKAQFRLHPDNPEECFKDGQEYYGTALHEMAHSTGHPSRLNRLDNSRFGSPEYAKEELVAELTSAMVGTSLGFDRRISDNNVAYLQNWISVLRKEPKFLVSVMADVNKASKMIIENIDKQRIALGEEPLIQGSLDGVEEKVKNEQQLDEIKTANGKDDPREAVAKEWASFAEKPTVEISGDVLTVDYNKEKDTLDVLITNKDGEQEVYSTNYDHDRGIQENVAHVWEELSNMEHYKVKEDLSTTENPESLTAEEDRIAPKEYFTTLMTSLNDDEHEGHTALDIKNMSELRDYFKDNRYVGEWVAKATDKEIIEAGADMLPNIRYSHKEGRTLYDMEAAYSRINAKYEDVSDNRTRQIAHRIDQAKTIVTAYHNNIEEAKGKDYLFKEDSVHKMIPREDYAKSEQQTQTVEPTQENMEEKYYFSYSYLQSQSDTEEFDRLQDKNDYKGILALAEEYDQGDALEQNATYKKAEKNPGDDILDEDDNYAVVYNNSVGGTYELMRKVTKENILDNIERYGLESDASDDVKKVAYENVAKQFSDSKSKIPAFTMPNEDVLYFQYNQENNKIEVGTVTNIGLSVQHSFDYDVDHTLDDNLDNVYEQLSELPEYQMAEEQDEDLDEELQEEQEPEYQKKEEKGNEVAHEDSNVQTDVAGLANDIAETGVPMEEAEKEAKTIVDDKQHEAFHEDEAKKREQEKAEKEQQESKKKGSEPSKVVAHAAILLGALATAKANDGVWMNKESKSNAEFMFSHTPVTAYNNIMMNLESDQKGYRTNVFTFFDKAQKNGVAIKQGEKSTPFNWTQWDYQSLTDKDDIISKNEYEKLSDEDKKMYGRHASRLTQNMYNIDQTTYPAVGGDKFIELLKEKGAQQESMKPTVATNLLEQVDELKKKHPDTVIMMRVNDVYEIYRGDAKKVSDATQLPVTKNEVDGKKVDYVSFQHTRLDTLLPKIIRAGNRVAICDQLDSPKLVKSVPEAKDILDSAYATARAVAKQEGMKYERVMVLQDAKYDKAEDKIVVSGMSDKSIGSERIAALQKANDIYRAVVAATGTENRLDRSERNNLLPEDDAKHEKLVQELAAGVLMARQGLPATLSKESQRLIPYWERELKENPKMVGVIERDVNNAVETIDNLVAERKVDYKAIRGQLPPKMIADIPENMTLATTLAKLPSIDTKEIVVVRDKMLNRVDVILPKGASLEADNEVPGMRKDRIAIALRKEGFEQVKFYNAGGSLGLNEPNSYFEGKDVTLNQLKQYQLVNHKTIDVTQQSKMANNVEIQKFQAIKDDNGRWAFYIKPKNEPQFSVYPTKEHMNTYFRVRNTPEEKGTRAALASKWYEVARQHPDIKVDIITPHPSKDIDMSRIVNPTITKSAQDNNVKLAFATIDGVRQRATINETQWNRMWLADDMAEYKKAVAAVVFEPVLKKGMESNQTQSEAVKEAEQVEVKDAPEPEHKQEEQEKQSTSRRMHI